MRSLSTRLLSAIKIRSIPSNRNSKTAIGADKTPLADPAAWNQGRYEIGKWNGRQNASARPPEPACANGKPAGKIRGRKLCSTQFGMRAQTWKIDQHPRVGREIRRVVFGRTQTRTSSYHLGWHFWLVEHPAFCAWTKSAESARWSPISPASLATSARG